ncbi:THUMP domain-containing protein 2 isoform X2 [Sceloporus undulatus]|uniref:THUMP domain-containing protein 2 isoform X2 n=1 Tax=Sceloporus undulatus TaxID=8520 RepID=UPI001C4A7757|nr:THUMP domain-containing protein 2 isoform X2 [Sceloporus undulatus]
MSDGASSSSERPSSRRHARYFCTAGRGMEAFLLREVRSRLGATEIEYVSGKVFFTTGADLIMLKKLKSAERLFLLLNKYPPLAISRNKGKVIYDIQNLVNENPSCWLDIVTFWKSLHDQEAKLEDMSQKYPDSQKRKMEDEINIKNKKQKGRLVLETVPAENQMENQQRCDLSEAHEDSVLSQDPSFLEKTPELLQEDSVESNSCISFRVSCRCSGVLSKAFTAQELGRIIGITLIKGLGWKADLRNPDIEFFVHLNDIYCIIGIPVFRWHLCISIICRLPLANRAYIKNPGLRSTIAWAMASLAEIKAGAFVLDPTCGLGTILLEAAMEWPNVNYLGTDISDSQLQGAYSNIKAANLVDKIQLLKASVTALPLPSESIDVVLADVPFGKKFKITKEMKLLPDVFQELERVLCAGGIVVLLLSQELYKCLSCGIPSDPESVNCISVEAASNCTQNAMVSIKSNAKEESVSHRTVSPSAQHERKEHVANKRTTLGSLVLVESFEVSLGKTDAFICKYKKPVASPTRR